MRRFQTAGSRTTRASSVRLAGLFQRVIAGACLIAAASSAGPARVNLDYQAGDATCPTRDFLTGQVERRLGHQVFSSAAVADLRLVITVEAVRFKTTLTLRDRDGTTLGERVLEPASGRCDELAESLPVVVSLLVNVPAPEVREPAASVEPVEHRVSAAVVTALGISPGPSLGAAGEVTFAFKVLAFEVGASVLFPSTTAVGARPTVRVGVASLVARGCAAFDVGRFELGPCVSAEAGVAWSSGVGLSTGDEQVRPMVALGPGGTATVLVSPSVRLRLDVGALLPLLNFRYTFLSGGVAEVAWQAWVANPFARLGVAVSF